MVIENRTFDEIQVGESAALKRTLAWPDIEPFAVMSGDVNPAHVDAEYARSDRLCCRRCHCGSPGLAPRGSG
ncbi:MAG TPA: MaoC/PaaZ C-terminal domain-containing protein [Solirubrobacteraceae bacterium]